MRGTLANIVSRVSTLEIAPPALLIVGNVAGFSADLQAPVAARLAGAVAGAVA